MPRIANFDYNMILFGTNNTKCLLIVDKNMGGISVTNSIEDVTEFIAAKESINLDDYVIIYRDSMNIWDGWDSKTNSFIPLQLPSYETALKKAIKIVDMKLTK